MIERILKKLHNNILSPRACSVLGPKQYARLLGTFAVKLPAILKCRDLRPLDEAMSGATSEFSYRGMKFKLDLPFCDEEVRDGSFAFGGVREIYIRDCYFKFHDPSIFRSAKIVVDIGANRGVFSTLMATVADRVICVEGQRHFMPVIEHNMATNGFRNYTVDCAVVGSGGVMGGDGSHSFTMDQLFQRHGLTQVDLLKLDIEGSEFSLFLADEWLDRVRAISMEVHRAQGRPSVITDKLGSCGFRIRVADENLKLLNDPDHADFIYASK